MPELNQTDSGDLIVMVNGDAITYNRGDISFILACTALVILMAPGLGFFYSGLLRRKNALSMLMMSMAVSCVIAIQWFLIGYTLSFAPNASPFIGTMRNFGLMNVLEEQFAGALALPQIVYCVYQMAFAMVTAVIVIGGMAERGRLAPALVFVFIWSTLVYNPVANWTWNPPGFLFKYGSLDFAGGGPVHMTSGTAAFAYSLWVGRRRGYGTDQLAYRPHNISHVVLGTSMLFFGWLGFNGGSALSASLRAAQAFIVTIIAPAAGGLAWMVLDWRLEGKWSCVGLCSGMISGLVGITPAAGYVGAPSALAIGFLTSIACNQATRLKTLFKVDECLDVAATHMVGGAVGAFLTGIFADSRVAAFDGTVIAGGWINKNYIQLGWEMVAITSIISYSFVVTLIILVVLDYIPGLSLRASEEAEIVGIDAAEIGEYGYDYVMICRDVHEQPRDDASSSEKDEGPFNNERPIELPVARPA